ncbi:MAG: DUF4364 family protein [Thaumarchaeota archaeon]|nr:MAG: DUF4364 family protein [Nitrososphaerota archaeon]
MKYRSRAEIVAMMLDSMTTGATKTKIMYKAFLSYTQLKEYLSYMAENDLIRYEEGTQLYKITDKGKKYMHVYTEIDEMVSSNKDVN